MKINPNTFDIMYISDAVNDMCDLYLSLIIDACKKCPTKKMAMPLVSKNAIAKKVQELGIPNPELKRFSTGEVALLSDWICDYMELTPKEWGGDYFADAGLIKVHPVDVENH